MTSSITVRINPAEVEAVTELLHRYRGWWLEDLQQLPEDHIDRPDAGRQVERFDGWLAELARSSDPRTLTEQSTDGTRLGDLESIFDDEARVTDDEVALFWMTLKVRAGQARRGIA